MRGLPSLTEGLLLASLIWVRRDEDWSGIRVVPLEIWMARCAVLATICLLGKNLEEWHCLYRRP